MKHSQVVFRKILIMASALLLAQTLTQAKESSSESDVAIDLDSNISISKSAKEGFDRHLETRSKLLKTKLPGLKLPRELKTDGPLSKWVETRSPTFPNRGTHCSFIQKLLKEPIGAAAKASFKALTQNGKLCIAGDLPESERDEWSFQMVKFLYEVPWIKRNSKFMTLIDFADQIVGHTHTVGKPALYRWSKQDMDATYSARSQADATFLKNYPTLEKQFTLRAPMDLSNIVIGAPYSEKLQRVAKEETGRFGTIFIAERAIYFTTSFGPADIPGILLHEYGHIVANEFHSHLSVDPVTNQIVFKRQSVFDEACAETFDRVVTGILYDKFPELEVQWIMKMILLSQAKSSDPHVMGNTLVLNSWHSRINQVDQLNVLMKKGSF